MVTAKLFLVIFVQITVVFGDPNSNGRVRICYFNAEARYREYNIKFDVSDIDYTLCTHYIYAYAIIKSSYSAITQMDPRMEVNGAYRIFTGRRNYEDLRRTVTLLISVGGPNISQHIELVELVKFESKMKTFSNDVAQFLRQYTFDGIDFDWQFPTTTAMRGGFAKLLEIMRQKFNSIEWARNFLITVKCPGVYNSIAYDVSAITRYADYVMIAAYNLPTPNPRQAWFGSPLYSEHIGMSSAVQGWLAAGLPAAKAVVGISPVGRFLRLKSASAFTPGSPIRDEVLKGEHFKILKGLAFPEICAVFKNSTKYHDPATEMNYMVSGTNWVGYDDKDSIEAKIKWINAQRIAGVMFSAIDMDDFTGRKCNRGRFPLIQMIKEAMDKSRENTKPLGAGALKENKAHRQECSHFFTIALVCYLYVK